MTNPEPVVVLYKSKTCGHCKTLENKWGKDTDTDNSTVMGAMKKVYPKIRTFVVSADDSRGAFDENSVPSDLSRWAKWFPMTLLVPGRIWDNAMAKLGPKNSASIIDGVQVFNGIREGMGDLKYVQKYNVRQPEEFARWLTDSLANDEFKKYHYAAGAILQNTTVTTTGLTVPILSATFTGTDNTTVNSGIKPLIKGIINSGSSLPILSGAQSMQLNTRTYIAAGPFEHGNIGDDICTMRIISRPK